MKPRITRTGALIGALALSASLAVPVLAFAQGNGYGQYGMMDKVRDRIAQCQYYGNGAGYADADGDGVCDRLGSGYGKGLGYVDEDGDGVCDNLATGCGNGAGYVDENDDGVCDNLGTGSGCGGTSLGRMMGNGNGRGCGRG